MTSLTRWAAEFTHDHGNWRLKAACRNADPALFDGDRHPGEDVADRNIRLANTNRVYCRHCPVITECGNDAIRAGDHGTLRAGKLRMTRPTTGIPAHKLSQIRSMAARHYTDREIGEAIGWHTETVRRARTVNGIPAGQPAHRPRRGTS